MAAAFVAGCGGGVSKDEYANRLDEVCGDLKEETDAIIRSQAATSGELVAQLEELRAAIRSGVDRVKGFERPDGEDGELAERYVSALETTFETEVIPALGAVEDAIRSRDAEKNRAAAARLRSIDESETQRLAQQLGADECARR